MIELNHRSIIRVHGFCVDGLSVAIVMELAAHGSLHNVLQDQLTYPSIPLPTRLSILSCILDGLHLLHSKNWVHRDLKSLNVLLKADWSACLADFGSTSTIQTQTKDVGTPLWQAPEAESGRYGDFTDIYSFGIVMYEVLTRKVPFEDGKYQQIANLRAYVKSGGRPSLEVIPSDCPQGYVELMKECWSQAPEKRPKVAIVKKSVQDLIKLAKVL